MGSQKNRLNKMGFFEHPKHMFKLMGKKIIPNLPSKILLDWTYGPKVSTHAPYEAEGVIFKDSSNFMACGIQCRACNLSEISMTCKAHFKSLSIFIFGICSWHV